MDQEGFKLIAIKPLTGCDPHFLKLLQPEECYYFYKSYRIETVGGLERVAVVHEPPPRIYDIGDIAINISAVAGRNGTGKSSLLELLYVAFYNIAFKLDLLEKKDEFKIPYEFQRNINVVLYYSVNEHFFALRLLDRRITFDVLTQKDEERSPVDEIGIGYLPSFFYSIVINYSQYALNRLEVGQWIKAIFHKNDGYQTPVVLSPYRKDGNININSENALVRSRLLVNLIDNPAGTFRFKNNDKLPRKLVFDVNYGKFQFTQKAKVVYTHTNNWGHRIFPLIFEVFFPREAIPANNGNLDKLAKEYIVGKIKTIAERYGHYHSYKNLFKSKDRRLVDEFLAELARDHSHITFKLRQALNFLRFDLYQKEQDHFEEDVTKLSERIKDFRGKHPDIQLIELIPPSFLKFDIEFDNEFDRFDKLSSGERQKIYSLSSLIYHLRNLDSISQSTVIKDGSVRQLYKYDYINIVFDEIELYYHPDLQRRFIDDLLHAIREARLRSLKYLNFIFITHSPFILSDISNDNILYLDVKDRKTIQFPGDKNTFGGNIHDLLANSFFLDQEGYMGEFANKTIGEAVKFLTRAIANRNLEDDRIMEGWSRDKARRIIDMIGEPLIKSALNEMYSQAFLQSDDEIDQEIARLTMLKNKRSPKP